MKKIPVGLLIFKVLSAAMAVLFIFWAYYQFNDPDSFRWIMVYGIAAIMSLLAIPNRLPATLPLVLGGVCILWAAYLSTQFTYEPPLVLIEEWREMMGLIVVLGWMGVLAWSSHRMYRLQTFIREQVLAKSSSGSTGL